jgi:uncharacterized protein (DUF433 family)
MPEILAFTAEQARRLTGLSHRQLAYWDRTGFFAPGHARIGRGPYSRLYTFRDIVGLRVIAILRKRVPLQELRRVGAWLSKRHDTPWSSLRFYLFGRQVVFEDPESGTATVPDDAGQAVCKYALESIAREVSEAAQEQRSRTRDKIGRIEKHRHVAGNAPVIAGTRIPTAAIRRFREAGYTYKRILAEYPGLTLADLRAAVEHEGAPRASRAG